MSETVISTTLSGQTLGQGQFLVGKRIHPRTLRTCCRCGVEFQTSARELVCANCRKSRNPRVLSLRERQIIERVLQAKANKEIAYELHLAEGTVKEYMNRIFRKVEVRSRTELAIWALTSR